MLYIETINLDYGIPMLRIESHYGYLWGADVDLIFSIVRSNKIHQGFRCIAKKHRIQQTGFQGKM